MCDAMPGLRGSVQLSDFRERKTHPKKSNTKICFLPTSPPFKILCVCVFPTFQREKQPEHKEFQGLKAPSKVDSGMGFLVKSLCLGVFSALKICGICHKGYHQC